MVQKEPDSFIEFEDVSCQYDQHYGIQNISFSLKQGKLLSICGPSGSGKTTLLRLLAGLESPQNGIIRQNGISISTVDFTLPPHRRQCAMIFQQPALWPHMSVNKHLQFASANTAQLNQNNKTETILKQIRLSNKAAHYPHQLSGGEQQRLAIGRAFIMGKKCLLMDEPFSSLDFQLKAEMMDLVREQKKEQKTTILHVTHNFDEILQLSDEVLVLKKGVVSFYGSRDTFSSQFETIFSKYKHT